MPNVYVCLESKNLPHVLKISKMKPFVHPKPFCTAYSPPPPDVPISTALYCNHSEKLYYNRVR